VRQWQNYFFCTNEKAHNAKLPNIIHVIWYNSLIGFTSCSTVTYILDVIYQVDMSDSWGRRRPTVQEHAHSVATRGGYKNNARIQKNDTIKRLYDISITVTRLGYNFFIQRSTELSPRCPFIPTCARQPDYLPRLRKTSTPGLMQRAVVNYSLAWELDNSHCSIAPTETIGCRLLTRGFMIWCSFCIFLWRTNSTLNSTMGSSTMSFELCIWH
jgi:hypothetical protein